ncbi:MAG: META domain-containing protein [Acidimicrobiales bacterium]
MTTSRPLVLLSVTTAVLLALAGCGSDTGSTGSGDTAPATGGTGRGAGGTATTAPSSSSRGDLTGTAWSLETYAGPSGPVPAAAPTPLTFGPAGALSGSGGCNRITGRYTARDGELTLDLGAMTQRACADPAVDTQEQAVVAALAKVKGFSVEGDRLTLTDSAGTPLLVYRAAPTGLAGSSWKGVGVNNGRAAVETNALTANLTLGFGADGTTVSGFDGCNDFSGTYTTPAQGNAVTITIASMTTKACAPDVAAVASQYTTALRNVAAYERVADRLDLRDANGATQATFTAAG